MNRVPITATRFSIHGGFSTAHIKRTDESARIPDWLAGGYLRPDTQFPNRLQIVARLPVTAEKAFKRAARRQADRHPSSSISHPPISFSAPNLSPAALMMSSYSYHLRLESSRSPLGQFLIHPSAVVEVSLSAENC